MVRCCPRALWILVKAINQCTQLSTTKAISLASLLKCPHFRSSLPELFCKRGVFCKIHRCFVWHRIFLWILRHFKENFFSAEHLKWLLLAFAPIEIFYSHTLCNKSAAEAWICLVSFHGGAKDFIFTSIFLKIITFFIKI